MQSPWFPLEDVKRLSRRSFLAGSVSLAAATLWSNRAIGFLRQHPTFTDPPFQLGVASGDPSTDGFVIWTRLAPKPLEGGGMPAEAVEVSWQVADDEAMTKVVRQGVTAATPEWAHSVHVEVDGLKPDRWYWYQFKAGSEVSGKGRARTMPDASSANQRLRFAFASCQHYETGYFTPFEHMAAEDLELILHLGDYIYEGAGREKQIRKHIGPVLNSLFDYRNRHAQYKTDAALQAAHAHAPWVVTWDDHEFANNCAGAISENADVSPEKFLQQRARAYQAYYEHMPLRRSSLPHGPDMRLYRKISFGQLADFFVLDTRQYRTDQPCGDGTRLPCAAVHNPQGTVLGSDQRQWLFGQLAASPSKWNVLAQQIMMARVDRLPGEIAAYSMDQWPGYEFERRQVLKFLRQQRVSNPVVLAGDIHSNWANHLIADFDDLESQTVATEFVGTSISSSGDGVREPKTLPQLLADNPFVQFHNAERGYVRCEVTPREWRTDFQVVEYVSRPGAPLRTRASFVIEDGRPELQKTG